MIGCIQYFDYNTDKWYYLNYDYDYSVKHTYYYEKITTNTIDYRLYKQL
jgi:hypothetical protein